MFKRLVVIACLLMLVAMGTTGAVSVRALSMQTDACSGLPESRLSDGALAKVVAGNSPTLPGAFLKPEASRLGPVLRYLPLGTVVKVSGESKCSEAGERWWSVTLVSLKGWLTESSGADYILEPFSGEAPKPLDSTIAPLLSCIRPELSTPTPTAKPPEGATPVLRVVFGGADGSLQYSDNLGPTRTIQQFDPPPLSIDLSPDGSAALVITYNGLYWVDLVTGQLVLIADSTTFGLLESMWLTRVVWVPDGTSAALEIKDTTNDITTYSVWTTYVNGVGQAFRADTGKQPANSIRRTPQRDRVILLSANDISPYPKNNMDDPPAFLDYVPQYDESDTRDFLAPAISWASDASGFYTYIPVSDNAPPDDQVGGHLWYVPFGDKAKDLGKSPKVETSDYVIPSPDGKMLLLGSGSTWRIQNPETGEVIQTLPPVQYLFDWTPDSKGVVFTHRDGSIGYLGLQGETSSVYVPKAADNLYGIQWLPDDTTLYVVQGKDQKLSFSVQKPGQDSVFMGIVSTVNAYSVALFPTPPGLGKVPQPCAR